MSEESDLLKEKEAKLAKKGEKADDKKAVDVVVDPAVVDQVAGEAVAEEKPKVECTLCVPPSAHVSNAIYEHVGSMHKGWRYSSKAPHFYRAGDRPGAAAIPKRKGVSEPALAGAPPPTKEKPKFYLNIGLQTNLAIMDGLGKMAENKEAFRFDDRDLATLKEAYDHMGGMLVTDDPKIAILVINAKIVIPGLLFNWENIKNNFKQKFKGLIGDKFGAALERGRMERERKARDEAEMRAKEDVEIAARDTKK